MVPINIAASAALLAALIGAFGGYKLADVQWEAKYTSLQAQHAIALKQATDQAREREHELQDQIQQVVKNAKVKQDQLDADNRELGARIKRLLQTANSGATIGQDSCATDGGQTAQAVIDLRTELFFEAVRAGEQLAVEADRRGVAGEACEAAYTKIEKPSD